MTRVLLLDDTPDRTDLATVLEENGYDVVLETDGDAGIAGFRETPFDLVLLDLALPRRGGSTVLVHLVTEFPAVQVLVMARGPETISTRAYLDIAHECGTVRTLPKPFTAEHFLRAVGVMIHGGEWSSL